MTHSPDDTQPDDTQPDAPTPEDIDISSDAPDQADPPAPEPLPGLSLREPLPSVIDDDSALAHYCAKIATTDGPVALDAERASGYRYSQRAYLIQVRRHGAGTALIDPIAFPGLSELDEAIGDAEWILHAATQDLPCLREVGMRPRALFDTELAGRLLNLPRVGLASLVEHYLSMSLAKEHSAADWSTRPLPEPWLEYAALDVEVLIELRNMIESDLDRQGKLEWAHQEFTALLSFTSHPPKEEAWRRTSGIHQARGRRMLALVRELWQQRDAIAADRDVTPGRIMPDTGLLEIAKNAPTDEAALRRLRVMKGRGPRRFMEHWLQAVADAQSLSEDDLPSTSPRREGPPPPRAWNDKFPEAATRLAQAREAISALAAQHDLPPENLVSPGYVRQLAWEPPPATDAAGIGDALLALGARPWQVDLTAGALAQAFQS